MTITTETQHSSVNSQQIMPTGSLQYRAIGRMWGQYVPSNEQIRKGQLITADGVIINVNVKSKLAKKIENNLDLSSQYLWTVYPKTPSTQSGIGLYLTLLGIKAPATSSEILKTELQWQADNFSIQGEVIYQDFELGIVTVKIRRKPGISKDKPTDFKLRLLGFLPSKSAGHFWNLYVRRVGTDLVIQSGECIKFLRDKPSKTQKISTTSSENNYESVLANPTQQSTQSA
ncbi:hypothetical protein NIES2111_65960 (plasmid) [Nostoc sp. NIES-2111]|nr:hypothetical protein NIES2111_65960 [Nostoc sp. NIES-2111]